MPKKAKRKIRKHFPMLKFIFFLLSLAVSWWLVASEYPQTFIDSLLPFKLLMALVAGAFYTSYLTTPIAIVAIFILSGHMNPFLLAGIGGIGGTLVDLLIVKYYRDVYQLVSTSQPKHFFKVIKQGFKSLHLDLVAVILGAFIIASPFPDELGLLLVGAANISIKKLMVLTFCLNFLGILALTYVVRMF